MGIPNNLNNPEDYTPTPWENYTYDANDLASLTHANEGYLHAHAFTPKSATVDALGRTIKTTDWKLNGEQNEFNYQYDIQGNVLQVADSLNRNIFINKFDLQQQALATQHLDAGLQTSVFDATGKPVLSTDSKGARSLNTFDVINRPKAIFAKDKTGEDFTVRRFLLYGDDADSGLATPTDDNMLGKLYKQYDESGMNEVLGYDFKGNITAKKKKVIKDNLLLNAINDGTNNNWEIAPYRTEWTLSPWDEEADLLEGDYQTDTAYDALNRATQITYPADVNSNRKALTPEYNKAGLLEKVKLDNDEYVSRIAYNAKGQRLLIAFGNEVMTRYAYDKKTFRLKRYRTETYSENNLEYSGTGGVKEDRVYQYDLVGNVLKTNDNYTGCGLPANPNELLREFKYDEFYRLLEATGREYDMSPSHPWDDITPSADPNATTVYRRKFTYDKMGNTQTMQHIGSNNFTRNLSYNNNRLHQLTTGANTYNYIYDNKGNLIKEFSNRFFEWDFSDKLRSFYNQASSGSEPTIYEQYLYDETGTRIKKLTRKPSGVYEVTVYIDGIFEYHKKVNGTTQEKNYIHVMDDKKRIAEVRIESFSDDDNKPIKYLLEDHLQSVSARLDENGTVIDREEFYPYGESSVTTFSKKRFRFTGKERDNYSGLYYFGARYYSCWTQTFLSVDPAHSETYTYSPYVYGNCNPVVKNDPSGMQAEKQGGGSKGEGSNLTTKNTQTNNANYQWSNAGNNSSNADKSFTGGNYSINPTDVSPNNKSTTKSVETKKIDNLKVSDSQGKNTSNKTLESVKETVKKGVETVKETTKEVLNYSQDKIEEAKDMTTSFKVELKTTLGVQVGAKAEVANRKVGGEFNIASLTIGKLSIEQQESDSGPVKFDGFLITKENEQGDNYVEVNQSISGGLGIVSGGVEREFQGTSYGYDNLTDETSVAIGAASATVKINEDGELVENKMNIVRGKIYIFIGFEFKVSFGKTKEIIK